MVIKHQGVDHQMAILTVEGFIDQQKRAEEHAALVEKVMGDEGDGEINERRAIEIIKEAVESFFPTLPVAKLETQKLLVIFAWLNEVSAKINEDGAPEGAAGNGDRETA